MKTRRSAEEHDAKIERALRRATRRAITALRARDRMSTQDEDFKSVEETVRAAIMRRPRGKA